MVWCAHSMPAPASSDDETQTTSTDGLVRAIGLPGATLLVIGNVIGSAIFLTSGVMAADLQSIPALLAAWLLGGLLAMAGGLTFAEMGAMLPRTGGLYVFLEEAYGPVWGFLFGWAALLVVLTGSVAGVAVGFAEYFSYFVPALSTLPHRLVGRAAARVGRRHRRRRLDPRDRLDQPGRREHRQPRAGGADGAEGRRPRRDSAGRTRAAPGDAGAGRRCCRRSRARWPRSAWR